MRAVSSYTLCGVLVVWTVVFLLISRYFLYSAHRTWSQDEENKLLFEVQFKIDNLDARNLRQLNQLYTEITKIEKLISKRDNNCSHGRLHDDTRQRDRRESDPPQISQDVMATMEPSIAVLVIACNRETYIKQTLDMLLNYRPSAGLFPIIVSQDCGHAPTAEAINKYGNRVTHIQHPDLSEIKIPSGERKIKNSKAEIGYYKISRHYKWALSQVLDDMGYHYVIVVEDDLLVAPDFYSYFSSLRPLLDSDPALWCVSAWNDNGKAGYINTDQADLLYLTDFFPGLGWMLSKRLWEELKPKWPLAYWDDWMREPEQRLERACVRPEVSRTKTIGKMGVSTGQYFNSHLQYIVLNDDPIDFSRKNLSVLQKTEYDRTFVSRVVALPSVSVSDVLYGQQGQFGEVQVTYSSGKDLESIAKRLKIMSDVKAGVPRTAYNGIVSIMYKGRRVHLTPPQPWTGYS